MAGKVVLEYRRDKTTESRNAVGRILYVPDEGVEEEQEFDTPDFAQMMLAYAKALKEHPDAQARFRRTDRPNMPEMDLDPLTAAGLREQTDKTVAELTNPPPVHIDMRSRIKEQ